MKTHFFEFDAGPQTGDQFLSFVDVSRLIAIEVGNLIAGTQPYSVSLIEEHGSYAGPLAGYATFAMEQDALNFAQVWRDRIASFSPPNSLFQWNPDDPAQRVLYYVDLSKIASVVIYTHPNNISSQMWGVGFVNVGQGNSSFVGEKFFATESDALTEAQLWRARSEIAKNGSP